MRDDQKRHEELGLAADEIAFYDAIVQNDAAVLEMGDATLKRSPTNSLRRCAPAPPSTGTSRERAGHDADQNPASSPSTTTRPTARTKRSASCYSRQSFFAGAA